MNAANLCPSPPRRRGPGRGADPGYRPGLLVQQPGQVPNAAGRIAEAGRGAARGQRRRDRSGPQHKRSQQYRQQRPEAWARRRSRPVGPEPPDQQCRLGRAVRPVRPLLDTRVRAANPKSAGDLADPFLQALSPRTRVLALTHVSNVSGIRLPVRELAPRARQRGIHVHVDGAQSWGALDVNLADLGCDSYTASAHKWFMGPKEAGILFVREERIRRSGRTSWRPVGGAMPNRTCAEPESSSHWANGMTRALPL